MLEWANRHLRHFRALLKLYANVRPFRIAFPDPGSVGPNVDFNSLIFEIPVSRGNALVILTASRPLG